MNAITFQRLKVPSSYEFTLTIETEYEQCPIQAMHHQAAGFERQTSKGMRILCVPQMKGWMSVIREPWDE
jgi:hypothetical protein